MVVWSMTYDKVPIKTYSKPDGQDCLIDYDLKSNGCIVFLFSLKSIKKVVQSMRFQRCVEKNE